MNRVVKLLVYSIVSVSVGSVISGCGGGSGGSSSSSQYATITRNNFENAIKAFSDSSKVAALVNALWYLRYQSMDKSEGEHSCSKGGKYKVENISTNQKKVVFSNCKKNEDEISGTLYINESSKTLRFENIEDKSSDLIIKHTGLSQYPNSSNTTTNFSSLEVDFKNGNLKLNAKDLELRYSKNSNVENVVFNALVNTNYTNGWVRITTLNSIQERKNDECPYTGNIKIMGSSNYINLKFTPSFNVDVYFNGESSVLHSYNSCKDLPTTK